jgi:ABC-type uncharacterized transport system permease subunit
MPLHSALSLLAALLYFTAGGLGASELAQGRQAQTRARKSLMFAIALAAVLLHALTLADLLPGGAPMDLRLTATVSLILFVLCALFLVAALLRPVENLGALVLPLGGLAVLLAWLWPGRMRLLEQSDHWFALHLIIAFLAYALLGLATLQALLLAAQERRLKQHHPGGWLRALPPMQTMEALLFQLIWLGFILLTVTLATGSLFSERLFGRPFVWNHHVVLSVLAWTIFAALLYGRRAFGWRGRQAARWTLGGFLVLVLAYLGTRFVLEILLHR